jgi:hypothetical protein
MVEVYAIMKNDVWDIMPRLGGSQSDGSTEKFKVGFLVRGFSHREGVDYKETFAPITKYTFIRAVTSLVSFIGWRIHQMDVKTAFLNAIIE